jgi:hypothetical protein
MPSDTKAQDIQLQLNTREREPSFESQSRTDFQSSNPSNVAEAHYDTKAAKFVTAMRKAGRLLGFWKGYNFALCKPLRLQLVDVTLIKAVIFSAGAMLGFTLARLPSLNIGGNAPSSFKHGASPGEWYYLQSGHYRVGITLHLSTILPAGLLMIWQFVPVIRQRFPLFHRINGYLVMILVFFGNMGALMIARRAFGGGLDIQAAIGSLVILSTSSICLAYYNIKRLQIDQHRAWTLRAMFYVGTIITARVIQLIAALIITRIKDYYQIQTCGEVASDYETIPPPRIAAMYHQCLNATAGTNIVVNATFSGRPEQVGASLGVGFGMALWMAILLHIVGVEIYLNLTPVEGHRLRNVSYERQLEAGYACPGSAGLTTDRWGDAPAWKPERRTSTVPIVEK